MLTINLKPHHHAGLNIPSRIGGLLALALSLSIAVPTASAEYAAPATRSPYTPTAGVEGTPIADFPEKAEWAPKSPLNTAPLSAPEPEASNVPEGWRRTFSDTGFAYRVETANFSGSIRVRTEIMNLRTGRITKPRDLWTDESIVAHAIRVDVVARGKLAVWDMPKINGIERHYYHFETDSIGDKKAPSNTNFVFTFKQDGIGYHHAVDIRTGEAYLIGESARVSTIWPQDVSPDGKWVVYSRSNYNPASNATYFQSLTGPKRITTRPMTSIEFTGPATVKGVIERSDLTPFHFRGIRAEVIINLNQETVTTTRYSIDSLEGHPARLENSILVYQVYGTLHIFDASEGLDNLRLIKRDLVLDGVEGSYRTIKHLDVRHVSGVPVLSLSYAGSKNLDCAVQNACRTLTLNTATGAQLYFAGTIRRVIRVGAFLFYDLQDGSKRRAAFIYPRRMYRFPTWIANYIARLVSYGIIR